MVIVSENVTVIDLINVNPNINDNEKKESVVRRLASHRCNVSQSRE